MKLEILIKGATEKEKAMEKQLQDKAKEIEKKTKKVQDLKEELEQSVTTKDHREAVDQCSE